MKKRSRPGPRAGPNPSSTTCLGAVSGEAPLYRDQPRGRRVLNSRWKHVTPGRVALAGFILLVLGLALNSVGFGWLVWLGLLSLAGAYLLFFIRPRSVKQGQALARPLRRNPGPVPLAAIQALDERVAATNTVPDYLDSPSVKTGESSTFPDIQVPKLPLPLAPNNAR